MLARLNPLYDALTNKLGTGAVNFLSKNPNGRQLVRSYVVPANPQTPQQVAIRGFFTAATQGYSALTQSQVASWKEVADTLTRTDNLGRAYIPSAKQLYMEVNNYRQIDAQALTSTPPGTSALNTAVIQDSPDGINSDTGGPLFVNAALVGTNGGHAQVRVSLPLPGTARVARPNELRLPSTVMADNIVTGASGSFAWSFDFANITFDWIPAQRVGVQIDVLNADYLRTSSVFYSTLVIATTP